MSCNYYFRDFGPLGLAFIIDLALLFTQLIIGVGIGSTFQADRTVSTESIELVALTDTNGTYYLDTCHENSSIYYRYLIKDANGKIHSARAVFIVTDETPHLEIVHRKNHNSIINYFFYTCQDEYQFFIPEDNIRYNFQ